jgi:hypothetical protein
MPAFDMGSTLALVSLDRVRGSATNTVQGLKVFYLSFTSQTKLWLRRMRVPSLPAPQAVVSQADLGVVPFAQRTGPTVSGLGVAAFAVGVALVVGALVSWQQCPEETRLRIVERVIELSPQPVRRLYEAMSPRYTRSMTQSTKKGPAQAASSRAGARRIGAKKLF